MEKMGEKKKKKFTWIKKVGVLTRGFWNGSPV